MDISSVKYKDLPALEIRTKLLTAIVIPQEGAKIASLRDNSSSQEFAYQNPSSRYSKLGPDGIYIESECSGFDDMFPTIDECVGGSGHRAGVVYPDHGEVCRMSFSTRTTEDCVVMETYSSGLFYKYQKTIREAPSGGLRIDYRIENLSDEVFECIWAAHFMIPGEEQGQVILPVQDPVNAEMIFVQDPELPQAGEIFEINDEYLRLKPFSICGNSYKYLLNGKVEDGMCGYHFASSGKTLILAYDKEKLPYLEIWMNEGGFRDHYNIALEPCTVAYDHVNKAKKRGMKTILEPGEIMDICLDVYILDEKTVQVNSVGGQYENSCC